MDIDGIDSNTALVASYRYGGFDMNEKDMEQRSGPEVKTTLRMPRDLWDRVRHRAIDEGLSVQGMVEHMLETYLSDPKLRSTGTR
jgi:hypothetical protein